MQGVPENNMAIKGRIKSGSLCIVFSYIEKGRKNSIKIITAMKTLRILEVSFHSKKKKRRFISHRIHTICIKRQCLMQTYHWMEKQIHWENISGLKRKNGGGTHLSFAASAELWPQVSVKWILQQLVGK